MSVIGQVDFDSVQPNRGGEPELTSLYWPFGFALVAGVFWVADTGNRRVLGWRGGLPRMANPPTSCLVSRMPPPVRTTAVSSW